jgi:hypothetical protein
MFARSSIEVNLSGGATWNLIVVVVSRAGNLSLLGGSTGAIAETVGKCVVERRGEM